jgi:ribosomal protein S18 acetylase RimI-like enzyme
MGQLEIWVEPIDVPNDRDAVIQEVRSQLGASPADAVRCGLALFNLGHPGELHAPLHVFLRDSDTHEVVGGLLGRTGRGGLHITEFWIAEVYRRQGHGSNLLASAEQRATSRGCRFAYLETFSFNAPAFYERNGYRVFGRLSGFSNGHTLFFMSKDLESKRNSAA